MRDICSDVADGVNPAQDPLNKGIKDSVSGYKVTLGQKHIGPSTTQVLTKHKKDIPTGCVTPGALLLHVHVLVHACMYMRLAY